MARGQIPPPPKNWGVLSHPKFCKKSNFENLISNQLRMLTPIRQFVLNDKIVETIVFCYSYM